MANHSENPLVIEPDSDSDPEEYSDAMAAQPGMPTKDENQVGNEDEFFDVDWNENKSDISEEDKEETTYENSAQDEKVIIFHVESHINVPSHFDTRTFTISCMI